MCVTAELPAARIMKKEQQRSNYQSSDFKPLQLFQSKVANLHSQAVQRKRCCMALILSCFPRGSQFSSCLWFSSFHVCQCLLPGGHNCAAAFTCVHQWFTWPHPLLPASHANYITTCTSAVIFVAETKARSLGPQLPLFCPDSSSEAPSAGYPFPYIPTP